MQGLPAVSVIVAARNAERHVPALLDALEAQDAPREAFELILVDDGSSDATARLAEERGWPAVIRSRGSRGTPAARNLGVERARAELLAITDADCVPHPGWISAGIARFAADPGLDALGGRIDVTLPDPPTTAALVDAVRFLDQERMVASSAFAVSANLWLRRDAFEAAGGFNPALRPNAQEDVELGRLLAAAGRRLAYAPEVAVEHPARDSLRSLAQKGWRLGRQHSTLRRHSRIRGPWLRPYFLRRKVLVPRGTLERMGRVEERGIHPGRARRAAMLATEVACVSACHVLGDLAGTAAAMRSRRSGAGAPADP